MLDEWWPVVWFSSRSCSARLRRRVSVGIRSFELHDDPAPPGSELRPAQLFGEDTARAELRWAADTHPRSCSSAFEPLGPASADDAGYACAEGGAGSCGPCDLQPRARTACFARSSSDRLAFAEIRGWYHGRDSAFDGVHAAAESAFLSVVHFVCSCLRY